MLLSKPGQSTEAEMYSNDETTPDFDEFLNYIGVKVLLKDFKGTSHHIPDVVFTRFHVFIGDLIFEMNRLHGWSGHSE